MRGRGAEITATAYLSLCLLLGGASAAGAANALLQLGGLIIILFVLWKDGPGVPGEAKGLVWLGALFVAVGLASLVPVAPSLWADLPFRDVIASGYRLLGMEPPAIPVSLSPQGTIASLLSLLPPAALFLLVLRLSHEERRSIPWVLLVVAGSSILLGAFQLMGGPESPLRFYEITNPHAPVGVFANPNHQATLLLCALPFTAVLATGMARRQRSSRSAGAMISVVIALFLSAGIAIVESGAGYGLFLPTALGTMIIYRRGIDGRLGWPWSAALALLLLAFVGAGLRGPLSTEALSAEVSEDPASRRVLAATTMEAVKESFPAGTGLGTFAPVYRQFENPNRVSPGFANHAHNDYLEIILEIGIFGIFVVLGFLFWWIRQSLRVLKSDFSGAAMARAGSLIIGVILMHSIVDYPLRTAALAAVLALACGLLSPAPIRKQRGEAADPFAGEDGPRHLEAG